MTLAVQRNFEMPSWRLRETLLMQKPWPSKYSTVCYKKKSRGYFIKGNGQKRELPVLFLSKTDIPERNSGRECCWPYLIGQHPLSPVLGQNRPGTPRNSYLAQLPPVFGHFMFRFWPFYVPFRWALLNYSNRSTWATRTTNNKSLARWRGD